MRFSGRKVVEKGVFTSPALGVDSPYELVEDSGRENGLAVRCVESKEMYDTDVLAAPTLAQLSEQHNGFVRELGAWLVANNGNPAREQAAVSQVRSRTAMDYSVEDLQDDVVWVRQNGLSARMKLLGAHLSNERKTGLLETAAAIAGSNGVSQSDAQFLELLGQGLGFEADVVMEILVSRIAA